MFSIRDVWIDVTSTSTCVRALDQREYARLCCGCQRVLRSYVGKHIHPLGAIDDRNIGMALTAHLATRRRLFPRNHYHQHILIIIIISIHIIKISIFVSNIY